MNAPVALFVYNRPRHTRRTLMSLAACPEAKETEPYIFCDGLKEDATQQDITNAAEVQKIAREKNWCRHVEVISSPVNKGLSKSIIGGVTDLVNRSGKIIVLEDDMEVSPHFLKYMNDGLEF